MARYEITHGGQKYEITAPDNASEEDVRKYVEANLGSLKPSEDTSNLEAAGRGALQGLTFGFSDEIYGGARGLYDMATGGSFNQGYNEGVEEARAGNRKAASSNPYAYYGGEIGSALLVPGGLGRLGMSAAVRQGASLGSRMAAGARTGAVYGSAYGAGTGEGGWENRLQNAALGGAAGALVGGTLPAGVEAGKALVRYPMNAIRATANPAQVGREKLGEALARDLGNNPGTANALSRRLDRANAAFADQLRDGSTSRSPMMVADLGGENTKNLLRSAANLPSEAADTLRSRLNQRQGFQAERMERATRQAMNAQPNARGSMDGFVDLARKRSKKFFDAAMNSHVQMTPTLNKILERPGFQRIREKTEEAIANEGGSITRPMELFHRMKMQIDREIATVKRGVQDGKASWDVRTLMKMKKDLVSELSRQNPTYKHALDTYSGSMAMRNAMEDGAEAINKAGIKSDQIPKMLKGLNPSERQAFREGAAQALIDKMNAQGRHRDRVKNVFGSPDMQAIVRQLFPTRKARREFQKRLTLEGKMTHTRSAVQGGSTTARQLAQADEAANPVAAVGAVGAAATGKLGAAINWLGQRLNRFNGMTPEVADSIIRAAMSNNGKEALQAYARELRRAAPRQQDQMIKALIAASTAGAT